MTWELLPLIWHGLFVALLPVAGVMYIVQGRQAKRKEQEERRLRGETESI